MSEVANRDLVLLEKGTTAPPNGKRPEGRT